jgi:hypothetical protein
VQIPYRSAPRTLFFRGKTGLEWQKITVLMVFLLLPQPEMYISNAQEQEKNQKELP